MTIEVKALSKSFGDRQVLNSISFQIPKGQIVFFLGQSGTGKSVLLKNIVGLLKPDQGKILVKGQDISELDEDQLLPVRRTCGFVFQQPALFDSLSIFENVAFGLRRAVKNQTGSVEPKTETHLRQSVAKTLQAVGLQPEIMEKRPAEISYGMQKRVSLARTLVLEPEILLFDEPTTGLDPVNTTAINRLIQDISRKYQTTSIVVSHDMRCAMEIADRIIFLDQGSIIFDGSPESVKEADHVLVKEFFLEIHR